MPRLLLLVICCFLPGITSALKYYEYSDKAREAYQLIFELRFDEARDALFKLQHGEPDNLVLHSLNNYMDCLGIFIGEQTKTYETLQKNKEIRLEALRQGDPDSPYYLYAIADIYLQWAITRVKFEDYFQAVMEIKRGFGLLERNDRKYPDFMPNKKNLGLLHALVGTVPDQYRWGLKLLGMSGTIAQGRAEIEEVITYARRHDFVFKDEVQVMYAYLLLHLENQGEDAWQIIQDSGINPRSNPLACFVMANVAMQTGRNDQAVQILSMKPDGPSFFPFPYLTFMEGVAHLNKLDTSAATYLRRFLRETTGRHYIKEAYQKLAWHYVVHGQPEDYVTQMNACKQFGSDVIDEDKTALHEARLMVIPDRDLLTARILFDGGYFKRAESTLLTADPERLKTKQHQLEYSYRLGRIHHALGQHQEAIESYQETITEGQYESFYYACNAALMIGRIEESQKQYEKARQHYELALSIKPDEYRSSLHQKAKAGLNRLQERSQ